MTTKDEALKQAREALIWTTGSGDFADGGQAREGALSCLIPAIAACREALAQKDEQEPVAEITADDMGRPFNAIRIGAYFYKEIPPVGTKLYIAPPERQPLTDEQIMDCCGTPAAIPGTYVYAVARAIEAAHGIGAEK